MTWVTLNMKSGNRKVGAIPVSTSDKKTCPSACPLKDTDCYARFGPLGMHWNKIGPDGRGDNFEAFCKRVEKFDSGQLWRHNQAGDLPPSENDSEKLDAVKCKLLSKSAKHTNGWTYTHYDLTDKHNRKVVKAMNKSGGLVVNLSADSLQEADSYAKMGIGPVTVTLPKDASHRGNKTPKGLPIVVCPAQTADVSCEQCRLCQNRDRKSIVGFLAHGTASKRLSERLS